MVKNIYIKGKEYLNLQTRKKVTFLKWLDSETANCLSKEGGFIQIKKETLEAEYRSVASLTRESKTQREKRQGQMW